jgi:DNA polymerase-3 subunit beta
MNVQVPRKILADSLSHVERIIPARSSNPGLSLLKLTLSEDALTLNGSDMNIDIETSVQADSTINGTFALPAHVFAQVVKSLPGELVELTFGDGELGVMSGSYATKLQLVDPSSVPPVTFPELYEGSLEASDLMRALSHVRYATAVAEYQAIFRGVKLELSDHRTRAVATDGFRLAYYNFEVASGLETDIVIPARSVDEIIKLLSEGEVKIALSDGRISLSNGHFRANIKLMEGNFPDYNRVIPSTFPVSITINAETLSQAVARVAVMADKTANNRVDMFIKEGTLQITAEGSYGRSQEALEVAQEGTDPEIALAYNAKYLIDALAPTSGDLQLRFSGASSPSVLSSVKDPNYLAMVVPLRTG